ncbi:MAG: A24 family peptidase C-terminal domain-containing protein [Methanobacteriota archaeon]
MVAPPDALTLARLVAGTAFLTYASFTDWYWRRAPNVLWIWLGAIGLLLLLLELIVARETVEPFYLVFAAIFIGALYVLYWVGLIVGGADLKALWALAVLVPFPVVFGPLPYLASPLPASFAAFGNALLFFLVVPIVYLARNAASGRWRFPHALLGVPMPLDKVEESHVWPMERVKDGALRLRFFPGHDEDLSEELAAMRAAGVASVWVTPKVPFMIPLLVGFVSVFLLGDVMGGLAVRFL